MDVHQQRRDALEVANRVRVLRRDDKRAIKAGGVSAAEVLTDPPSHWLTATVLDVLMAMPGVGRTKALAWLRLEHAAPVARVGMLPEQQRIRIARHADRFAAARARRLSA